MHAMHAAFGVRFRLVAVASLLAACGSGGANVPSRTVAEAICHVGSKKDACTTYFQGNCAYDDLMRRSPKGGFTEGRCGHDGRFISEPAHIENEWRDYFFDGSGELVGMRWCGDMSMPCPSTAKTGTHVCQGWGDVPRCTMVTSTVHEPN